MVDICMCSGEGCPLKESCYRYKAKPSEYLQSYFGDIPYDFDKENCEYYWNCESSKDVRKLNNDHRD